MTVLFEFPDVEQELVNEYYREKEVRNINLFNTLSEHMEKMRRIGIEVEETRVNRRGVKGYPGYLSCTRAIQYDVGSMRCTVATSWRSIGQIAYGHNNRVELLQKPDSSLSREVQGLSARLSCLHAGKWLMGG